MKNVAKLIKNVFFFPDKIILSLFIILWSQNGTWKKKLMAEGPFFCNKIYHISTTTRPILQRQRPGICLPLQSKVKP